MKTGLSVLIITKNASDVLAGSLESVAGLADEIILVDDFSTDDTVSVAEKFNAKIFSCRQTSFGDQRRYGLSQCSNEWVLMLDADERISQALGIEIQNTLKNTQNATNGYYIPFQNYFLGIPLKYGGERYSKLILFKKKKAKIVSDLIHERVVVTGKTGSLAGRVIHHSYRSLPQMFIKFTSYAQYEAKRKIQNEEKTGLSKLLAYPSHMFYSRYFKDRGFQDHFLRIILDIGFAYMEFMTYFFMFFIKENAQKSDHINPVDQTKR